MQDDIISHFITAAVSCIFGLLFGSFANVCIFRVPRDESIVRPRSHCPSCASLVPWFHNIPVFSFLWLKGRCFSCHAPISLRYPLVEALMGALFLVNALIFKDPADLMAAHALAFICVVISFIDADHQIIPDVFSLGLLVAGMFFAPVNVRLGDDMATRLAAALLGGVCGFAVLYITAIAGQWIWKKEAMGGGDIKLLAALGVWTGWRDVIVILFAASLLGTLWALGMMLRKKAGRGSYLPFGPFLAMGGWLVWISGGFDVFVFSGLLK